MQTIIKEKTMTNEELNSALYKKIFDEQIRYRDELLALPPKAILSQAFDYVQREDILFFFEENDLSDEQCSELLKLDNPLADIFSVWEDSDNSQMTEIGEAVEDYADSLIKREKYKERAKHGIEMSYGKMRSLFCAVEKKEQHITGYIVFNQDSFPKTYDEISRTYAVSSDNKAFQAGMGGYSIYGSCLDGKDSCVRLEQYMATEKGDWKIERCYMTREDYALAQSLIKDEPEPEGSARRTLLNITLRWQNSNARLCR